MADDEKQPIVCDADTNVSEVECSSTAVEDSVVTSSEVVAENEFFTSEENINNPNKEQDILQQALQEAEDVSVNVVSQSNCVQIVNGIDESEPVLESDTSSKICDDNTAAQKLFQTITGEHVLETNPSVAPDNEDANHEHVSDFKDNCEESAVVSESSDNLTVKSGSNVSVDSDVNSTVVNDNITLKPPLGSSQNPIHIVQQGNTYHSTQDLSKGQLQQIAQVLHKQQIVQALKNGGSSVVYNPETNTRIVYRVVAPADAANRNVKLVTKETGISLLKAVSAKPSSTVKRGPGRPRKIVSKEEKSGENSKNKPDILKGSVDKKKNYRSRTRCGRISKPPSYMVKDYKRIHNVDMDDDDDDDNADIGDKAAGDYSDYKLSDSEDEKSVSETVEVHSFKCKACGKTYIGEKGLSRHYRLYPEHEDGKPVENEKKPASDKPVRRGRPSLSEGEKSLKRKARVKDTLSCCTDDEIQDVLLPYMVESLSVWNFMLKKCEIDSTMVDYCSIYKKFTEVASKIQNIFDGNLQPTSVTSESPNTVMIDDPKMATLFGTDEGHYAVTLRTPFHDLFDETLKRPREENEDENPPEKRLKLDWSGTLNLDSGADISISEVRSGSQEIDSKMPSIKMTTFKEDVSIFNSDNMEVSIAPIKNISQSVDSGTYSKLDEPEDQDEMTDVKSTTIQPPLSQINGNDNPETKVIASGEIECGDNIGNESGSTMDTNACTLFTKDDAAEIHDGNIDVKNMSEASSSNEISAIDAAGDVQTLENLPVKSLPDQQPSCENENQITEMGEQQVNTESLLGYLGEQLSAEALQPGNIVIIQNPDGTTTTVALSGTEGKEIPLETVQALLAMDTSNAIQQLE